MITPSPTLMELTAQIASTYCASNQVATDMLPALIRQIYEALADSNESTIPSTDKLVPAVPVKRSVFPDYIVCLDDGKKLKMLKRDLQAAYGMTPQQYRERWDLLTDYPTIAPNYTERRHTLAKENGWGLEP